MVYAPLSRYDSQKGTSQLPFTISVSRKNCIHACDRHGPPAAQFIILNHNKLYPPRFCVRYIESDMLCLDGRFSLDGGKF
jgi:hypothetical protein